MYYATCNKCIMNPNDNCHPCILHFLLLHLVLQSADCVHCFSICTGSLGQKSFSTSSPSQMFTSSLALTPCQIDTQSCTIFLQTLFLGEEIFFWSSERHPDLRAGDEGDAAAAHAVQFRCCLVAVVFNIKSRKNL